jgi:hypothetical protein
MEGLGDCIGTISKSLCQISHAYDHITGWVTLMNALPISGHLVQSHLTCGGYSVFSFESCFGGRHESRYDLASYGCPLWIKTDRAVAGERFGIWSSEPDDHASTWTAHSYPATALDWATNWPTTNYATAAQDTAKESAIGCGCGSYFETVA